MNADQVVELARRTLEATLWVGAPVLIAATLIGLVISILQTVTSIQDTTVSTVPRLAIVGATVFLLAPWMLRRLVDFTLHLMGDFHPFLR